MNNDEIFNAFKEWFLADPESSKQHVYLRKIYRILKCNGSSTDKSSINQRLDLYKDRIMRETASGHFLIGYIYNFGLGVEQNMNLAIKYYKIAYNKPNAHPTVRSEAKICFGDDSIVQFLLKEKENDYANLLQEKEKISDENELLKKELEEMKSKCAVLEKDWLNTKKTAQNCEKMEEIQELNKQGYYICIDKDNKLKKIKSVDEYFYERDKKYNVPCLFAKLDHFVKVKEDGSEVFYYNQNKFNKTFRESFVPVVEEDDEFNPS